MLWFTLRPRAMLTDRSLDRLCSFRQMSLGPLRFSRPLVRILTRTSSLARRPFGLFMSRPMRSMVRSATKAASDHIARAWHRTYGLPVIVSNCSNNYGPYQFPEKLIPLTVLNALDSKPLPVYGNGSNVRDWLYVDDHARALGLI